MQRPRFMFLAVPATRADDSEERRRLITWVLASSNSRLLARANTSFDTYAACHDELLRLREHLNRVNCVTVAIPDVARWTWRATLQEATIAVASRSYLRVRECHYSLDRFLDAVGSAEISTDIRIVDSGHRTHRMTRVQAAHDSFGVH